MSHYFLIHVSTSSMNIQIIIFLSSAVLLNLVKAKTPQSTNEFIELAKQPYYVDKSLLVHEFSYHRKEHNFITYPRQFGKTINMKMLKTFYQAEVNSTGDITPYNKTIAYEIFKSSKLFYYYCNFVREYMAQYPVLFFDFKLNISKTATRAQVVEMLNERIRKCFSEYSWMKNVEVDDVSGCSCVPEVENLIDGNLNEHELKYSILSFSIMLHKYFKKPVIILIDDYDYAFLNAVCDFSHIHNHSNAIHRYYDLVNIMLGLAFHEGKNIIDFTLLTGTGGKIFTQNDPFNTLTYHRFLDDEHFFTPYFGFNKNELEDLLDRYNCTREEHSSIRKYYKGYYTKEHRTLVYNPYSIVKYVQSKNSNEPGVIAGYWVKEEWSQFIPLVLQVPKFRLQLKAMVDENDCIELAENNPHKGAILETFYDNILVWGVPVEKSHIDDLFRYFFDLGYLSYKAKGQKLCVPNKEIGEFLMNKLSHTANKSK